MIAGDNTNLTVGERSRYFHSHDPETDYDTDINPHFDSLEGLEKTSFFTTSPDGLDCVFIMSTGPFDLEVGEQTSLSFSILFGQSLNDLIENAKTSQIFYNQHYNLINVCTDINACNYDEFSNIDDGSCLYDDLCGICGGSAGDLNFDGGINILDVLLMVLYIMPGDDWNNGEPPSEEQTAAADVTCDGGINILDVVYMTHIILTTP